MLISDAYREQNKRLHETRADYGTSGQKWSPTVARLIELAGTDCALDYGAGKETLAAALPHYRITGYDPAIPGLDAAPEKHLVVVCGDVLEHIEPECLIDVLDDLQRLTLRFVFLVVATRPAKKFLPDGRNAHLIQQPIDWWLPQLMSRWELLSVRNTGGEFVFVGSAKQ